MMRSSWATGDPAYFFFHALTYSTLNVEGKSLSSGIPNHLGTLDKEMFVHARTSLIFERR
jgi:hypothetical protein